MLWHLIAVARRRHSVADDQGSASAEVVIVMPLLLLLVLASVHIGLWFHAQHLADAAAQEGVRAARAAGATDADGTDRAQQMLRDLGSGSLAHPAVAVSRTAETVTVTVTGEAPAVVPGFVSTVSASTTSPIEAFRE
jgi:Flp pilus assembly protein TadG